MKLFKCILVALTVVAVSSCTKDDDTPQFDFEARLEEEKVIIADYVAEHFPDMVEDELKRGFWYEIEEGEEGDPDSYTYKANTDINRFITPTVTVNYAGKLLDGTTFDQNQSEAGFTSPLNQLISAWFIAFIPEKIDGEDISSFPGFSKETTGLTLTGLTTEGMKVGTRFRFITPSYYAYGNQARQGIPANSPLIFEIKVLNIKD